MSSRASSSALSQTLHQITSIKSAELEKLRISYASRRCEVKEAVLHNQKRGVSIGCSTTQLAQNVSEMPIPMIDDCELANVRKYLLQAAYDPSIPSTEISRYEDWLKSTVDFQTHRLDYATLFSATLSEFLDHRTGMSQREGSSEPSSLDGDYELLEKDRLRQLREKFEGVVFSAVDTDKDEIREYLESIFSTHELKSTMGGLRDRLMRDTTAILDAREPFNDNVLDWVIHGLLHNDLLREEQKTLLKTVQTDDLVRSELCDVLNVKWAELASWSWTEDGSGLNVEPRKQLNGKYRVVMQEDVLQSMLTHYIGVRLCVNAKEQLKYWFKEIMVPDCSIPKLELDNRHFYLRSEDNVDAGDKLANRLNEEYWETFFLSQLPNSVADTGGYDEDDGNGKNRTDDKKSWLETKQQLLHHVATQVLIQRKLHGDVAVVQTDLQWFATSIPHSTIFAILEFSGLPDKWLSWFRKYLEVPLNTTNTAGDSQEVKKRKRGIPMAHALEKYLGEMVLVYMDVAVKQEADLLIYRMHDDIVLYGTTTQCEKAWSSMEKFVEVMGLEFNKKKTGSVSLCSNSHTDVRLPEGDVKMDFLKLSPSSGSWIVDTEQVDAHTKQLQKQLDECQNILSYIRTYNSCIGRFFGHTFGFPAQCLGHEHVENILRTHQRMQQELFGKGGVSSVLKAKLETLAHTKTHLLDTFKVVDSFIYNPVLLGGLGVINPFTPLLLVETSLREKTPEQRVDEFIQSEKNAYELHKRVFGQVSLGSKKKRRYDIFQKDNSYEEDEITVNFDSFLTFAEYTKHREWTSKSFCCLYNELVTRPTTSNVRLSDRVKFDLNRVAKVIVKDVEPHELSAEDQYLVQLFSEELFETFGTVAIVDKSLASLGVMKAVMGEKVTWQMVL